jgi:hypothetical protein
MPKLVAFTVPTGETVYLNSDYVTNVHEVFKHENWAEGANTVILYENQKLGVREDIETVLKKLLDSPGVTVGH